MGLRLTLLSLCLLSGLSQAAVNCSALAEKISGTTGEFHPVLQAQVIGAGRLHFHDAPDEACTDKKLFVIPGDYLTAYSMTQDEKWLEVNFVAKSGDDYTGWVEADRVKLGEPYGAPPDDDAAAPATDAQPTTDAK